MPGTARKAAARKAAPRKATAPAAPSNGGSSFDFGSVSVSTRDRLPSSGKRGTAVPQNFIDAIETSWSEAKEQTVTIRGEKVQRKYGSVQEITVPGRVADAATRLLRRAADHLDGVGVRIVPGKADAQGNVTLAFRAQTKRAGSDD